MDEHKNSTDTTNQPHPEVAYRAVVHEDWQDVGASAEMRFRERMRHEATDSKRGPFASFLDAWHVYQQIFADLFGTKQHAAPAQPAEAGALPAAGPKYVEYIVLENGHKSDNRS